VHYFDTKVPLTAWCTSNQQIYGMAGNLTSSCWLYSGDIPAQHYVNYPCKFKDWVFL